MLPPLFNPSNDMALAANLRHYQPPRRIRRMEADLASLARFWDEGPWGWSLATKTHYLRQGASEAELPTDNWLNHHRALSSRAFACDYLARLLQMDDWGQRLVGQEMRFCDSLPDAAQGPLIFKSPWSSSGRGLALAPEGLTPEVRTRLEGFLRTQGGFLQDRFHTDKEQDFALEFWVHGPGEVEYLGLSLFLTAPGGAYAGNLLAPQPELLRLTGADEGLLHRLIACHTHLLGQLDYHGPVGIDMMRLAGGRLHPVVEINLRHNMGILALTIQRRGLTHDHALTPPASPGGFQAAVHQGLLRIDYRPIPRPTPGR